MPESREPTPEPASAESVYFATGSSDEARPATTPKSLSFNGKLQQYYHTSKAIQNAELNLLDGKTVIAEHGGSGAGSASKYLLRQRRRLYPSGDNDGGAVSGSSESVATSSDESGERLAKRSRRVVTRSSSSMSSLSAATSPSRSRTSTPTGTGRGRGRGRGRGHGGNSSNKIEKPICLLRDVIPPNLILLCIGVNPGIMTGTTGFAYAHPSNLFWKLLHSSGITTLRHPPSDTYRLPELYSVGNTNIVERPTRDASMLSKAEMNAGVPVLEAKIAAQRPEAVCLVGKGIWEAIWRVRKGRAMRKEEFHYGWQDEEENMGLIVKTETKEDPDRSGNDDGWKGARVFVATTTSGLAAGMKPAEKEAVWAVLGQWVVQRREERRREAEGMETAGTTAVVTTSAPVGCDAAVDSRLAGHVPP